MEASLHPTPPVAAQDPCPHAAVAVEHAVPPRDCAPVPGAALATTQAYTTMATHGKTFRLAARWFGNQVRDDAAHIYHYCRTVDDAVDHADAAGGREALAGFGAHLDQLYAGAESPHAGARQPNTACQPAAAHDPHAQALRELIERRALPRAYFAELLRGMAADTQGAVYPDWPSLRDYCYCVASTVGLLMTHIMGTFASTAAHQKRTLQQAAHLGMAMQLTNICRDVAEDAARGRVYLPACVLATHGITPELLTATPAHAWSPRVAHAVAAATAEVANVARHHYRLGARGLVMLPWRAAVAVRAAATMYAAIGTVLAARGFDATGPRAVVPRWRKAVATVGALVAMLPQVPRRTWRVLTRRRPCIPTLTLEVSDVI